jgi:integrase
VATEKKRRFSKDKLFPRGRIYWTWIAGKRVSTGCTDREAARKVRERLERQAADPRHAAAQSRTIWDMIEHAITEKRRKKGKHGTVAAATLQIFKDRLGHVERILGSECPLADVDYDAVGRFIAQRETEPGAKRGSLLSQHTISKELQHLRYALRLEKALGNYPHDVDHVTRSGIATGYVPRKRRLAWEDIPRIIESVAWGNAGKVTQATIDNARYLHGQGMSVRAIADEMRVGYATAHRYLRMKVAAPTRMNVIRSQHVAWMIACCARREESYLAEMRDHDLEKWHVRIRGTKTTAADAVITIAPRFRDLLRFALRERPKTGPLFPRWQNVYRALGLACDRIGIERLSPNDLRRTHSSILSAAGVPHSMLKNVTRHTTTIMLDRVYGQQTLDDTAHVLATIDKQFPALPLKGTDDAE